MRTVLLFLCILVTGSVSGQEYTDALMAAKMDLDSAWERTLAPPNDKICLPQEANNMRKKQLSDHDCIDKAIEAARTKGYGSALDWLMASQCYDHGAQDRVMKAGNDAVRYVMNRWGGGQDKIAGETPPASAAEPAVLTVLFTNHSGDWAYMYSLDSETTDGTRKCEEYIPIGKVAPNRAYTRTIPKGRYVWIRFSNKQNGCSEFIKEYKMGLAADETMSRKEEVFVK